MPFNNEANDNDITVTCEDSSYDVDEGDADFDFDCSASGPPGDNPDYTWSWSPTTNLTDHNTSTPTFAVPDNVDQDMTSYTYTVTATADDLDDGSSRPLGCPHRTPEAQRAAILALRRARCTYREISRRTGVAHSTVGRVAQQAGLNRLSHLDPPVAPRR